MEKGDADLSHEDVYAMPIAQAYSNEAKQPTDGDKIIRAFAGACYELYTEDDSAFRTVLHTGLLDRDDTNAYDLSPNDVVNISLRIFQKQLLRKDPTGYADWRYESPDMWKNEITNILSDDAAKDEIHSDLMWRNIQSNLASRSLPIQLLLLSERERLGDSPRILEIGISDGQLLKAINGGYGLWRDFEILTVDPGHDGKSHTGLKRAIAASRHAQELLRQPFQTGISLGIDVFNPNDIGNMQWIFACSFRPEELRDPVKRLLFKQLQEIKLSEIATKPMDESSLLFYEGDFSEAGMRDFATKSSVQTFDVVMFPTILYMQPNAAAEMLKLAQQYVRPGGIIVVQDRARTNPTDPTQLDFFNEWGLLNYRLLVQYPDDSNTFYEMYKMISDRAKQLILGEHVGRTALGRHLQKLTLRTR